MSNSHQLHPLFTPLKPVVRPLLPVVQGMVPLLSPMVSEVVHFNRFLHIHAQISRIPTPPTTFNSGWREMQEQKREDRMDADDVICLVEYLWGFQSEGEFVG